MTDASTQLLEKATYCKPNDELRPNVVGLPDFTTTTVCPDEGDPDPVDTAYPDGWYVRIMFDELLDPSIEDLTPVIDEDTGEPTGSYTGSIAAAHPVTLECRSVTNNQFVNVDYDGYYSPSGNRVTWPVGPSIVIKPNDPTLIATNTDCQVTLTDAVHDKDGHAVPEAQRGPFPFKIAPITVIALDPADDPDFDNEDATPIDALHLYYDNAYVQFNTAVNIDSLCPDADDDDLCDDETVFAFKDVGHPNEGPGYCDTSGETCGTFADCPSGMGDTLCGRGFCTSGAPCNTAADCPATEHCGTSYAYDYVPYGGTAAEFGLGPVEPLQTDHTYTFGFVAGAKLKDRCGRETTLKAANIDDLTLAHFATTKFDLNDTSILTGEVASAMKRLQFNFNNVLLGSDTYTADDTLAVSPAIDTTSASPAFTVTPLPKILTGPCPGGGAACTTANIDPAELLIVSPFADGQTQMAGHLQMNTEYTATLKAGTVVKDFYGATWTNDTTKDMVIKWKTQPAIQMTGIVLRNSDQTFSTANNGTLTKDGADIDVRFSFNAAIDPTTLDAGDYKIEPAVAGTTFEPLGCGADDNLKGWYPGCALRVRAPAIRWPAGTYKITLLKGAKFKDIFGIEYTHPDDTTITVDIEEAPAVVRCL